MKLTEVLVPITQLLKSHKRALSVVLRLSTHALFNHVPRIPVRLPALIGLLSCCINGFNESTPSVADILPHFSGNYRAISEVPSEGGILVDGSLSFAVFKQDGTPGDVFGTGLPGFDSNFRKTVGAPDFDTTAEYLYLYQYVNDGSSEDISRHMSLRTSPVTSWGWWIHRLADDEGPVGPNNPFGRNTLSFEAAAPAVLGVVGGHVSPVQPTREPSPLSYGPDPYFPNSYIVESKHKLLSSNTLSIVGFTSNRPPEIFPVGLNDCIDTYECGSRVGPLRLGVEPSSQAFVPVNPQATYLRAASEGSLCDSSSDTAIPCNSGPSDPSPGPEPAEIIELANVIPAHPIRAGDWILLQRVGDFVASQAPCAAAGTCGDNFPVYHPERPNTLRNLFGVFSASDTLRDDPEALKGQKDTPIPKCLGTCVDTSPQDGVPDNLNPDFTRVPDAVVIAEGNAKPFNTDTTRFPEGIVGDPFDNMRQFQLTDIDEDFVINLGKTVGGSISSPEPVLVRVPQGATYLFLSAGDGQFFDNTHTTLTDLRPGDTEIYGKFGVNIALVEPGRLFGDYDGNGQTDGGDFLVWQLQLGRSGLTLSADGNADGKVTGEDLDVWRAHYGQSLNGLVANAVLTPEPAAGLLLLISALYLFSLTARERRPT